jgi:hypothetical protein
MAAYLAQLPAGANICLHALQPAPCGCHRCIIWHSCVDGHQALAKLGRLVVSILHLLQLCSHSLW